MTRFELPELAKAAGATFSPGRLVSVDSAHHLALTSSVGALRYDLLLIACGAVPTHAIPGAQTFRGPADAGTIEELLTEIEAGAVRRVAYVVPSGPVWSLPAYELALMTATWVADRGISGVAVAIVTPEDEPLGLFGPEASRALRELLDDRGVALHSGVYAEEVRNGELVLAPDSTIPADRVVALPRLQGPRLAGIPQTAQGFIPVDTHARVTGVADVYAAGDVTSFPVKQGGIAAQQADTAAEAIAAEAGADLTPRPFRPVLRGLLLTGSEPRYLRRELTPTGETSSVSPDPLWWPPAKIVGHYLAPFLGALAGVEVTRDMPSAPGAVPVEVELDADELGIGLGL